MDAFPKDWKIYTIGQIGEPLMCKRILKEQTAESGDVPFYKIGTFGRKADAYISRELYEEFKNRYSYPKKGDILISAAGTIGRLVVFDGEDAYFQDSNIVWLDNDESIVSNPYLFWAFQNMKWQSEDGGIVSRLYNNNFKAMRLVVPPLPEQRRIAAALGDMDKLIDNLSKRIEKKKAIKQGAMQELLTGKKRLSGFEGMWLTKELGQLVTMFSGGTPPSREASYYGGGIPWVSIGDITVAGKWIRTTEKTLSASGFNACSARMYPPMSLLFAMYASIGKCCISKDAVCSSQAILGLYDFRGVDIEYLFQNLSLREDEFAAMGQTGTQSNLSKQIVSKIKVRMPKDVAEQQAIAKVLGDMDAEIIKLEAKREKLIGIKKGMMGDLLTGRVRLKGT